MLNDVFVLVLHCYYHMKKDTKDMIKATRKTWKTNSVLQTFLWVCQNCYASIKDAITTSIEENEGEAALVLKGKKGTVGRLGEVGKIGEETFIRFRVINGHTEWLNVAKVSDEFSFERYSIGDFVDAATAAQIRKGSGDEYAVLILETGNQYAASVRRVNDRLVIHHEESKRFTHNRHEVSAVVRELDLEATRAEFKALLGTEAEKDKKKEKAEALAKAKRKRAAEKAARTRAAKKAEKAAKRAEAEGTEGTEG